MAVRNDFTAGEVLAAADLNDTFASKLDLAGGKILQIVRATDSTNRTITSTSLVDVTGMSVTITPQKSDSAILVITGFYIDIFASIDDLRAAVQITDSSNNVLSGADYLAGLDDVTGTSIELFQYLTIIGYSTPATTSATTYKIRSRVYNASTSIQFRNTNSAGQLYAIEVSA